MHLEVPLDGLGLLYDYVRRLKSVFVQGQNLLRNVIVSTRGLSLHFWKDQKDLYFANLSSVKGFSVQKLIKQTKNLEE